MIKHSTRIRRTVLAGIGAGALLVGALTGCSTGGAGGGAAEGGTQADIDKAVEAGGTLTWWTWGDTNQKIADAFMKENPNVKVKVVELENPDAVVTKLQNAVKAGKGAPDIVPVEYQTIPQLAMGKALADMSAYGLDSYDGTFSEATWNAVHFGDKLVAIPADAGPMVMIYNTELFAKAGIIAAPKTWDEYADAATKLHAVDPDTYIANSGDAGFFTSMIWASGGKPFAATDTTVTVDLGDAGTTKFADYWSTLLQAGELSPIPTWSDEWNKALTQDKLGSLLIGSWMVGGMNDYGSGKWKVAPMPTWDGKPATAQNGGSSMAATEQSENKLLAAALLQFIADGGGRDIINASQFPSTNAVLDDEQWLSATFDAYGDQEPNRVAAEASRTVVEGWQYLPYQGYANNVFGDSVGKALEARGDLAPALLEWQDTIVEYGKAQGFAVNE